MMTEIAPGSEQVTAVLTSHLDSGEDFEGALIIGVYPQNNMEVWVEFHGVRTNIQCSDIDALCKQLKRAKRIAIEQEQ